MHRVNAVFILVVAMIVGCTSGYRKPEVTSEPTAIAPKFVDDNLFLADSSDAKPSKSGRWIVKGREMRCDGYLTRNESEDFCSASIPEDWQSFEYGGQMFYLQPLSGG